jgi:hypothetical protein
MQFLPHLGSEPVAIEFAPPCAECIDRTERKLQELRHFRQIAQRAGFVAMKKPWLTGHSALARETGRRAGVTILLREEGQLFGLKGVSIPSEPE